VAGPAIFHGFVRRDTRPLLLACIRVSNHHLITVQIDFEHLTLSVLHLCSHGASVLLALIVPI
jgi:hypothetical protein